MTSEQRKHRGSPVANMPGLETPQFEKAVRRFAGVRKFLPSRPRTDLRSVGGNQRRRVGLLHGALGFEEVSPCMLLIVTLLLIFAKRRSLRPGGYLQRLVKRRARGERARRNRRALALLDDPVLARDFELRLEATLGGPDQARAEMDSLRSRAQRTARELEACGEGDDYDGDMGRAYSKSLSQLLSHLSFAAMAAMFVSSYLVASNGTKFLMPMDFICIVINALDDYLIMKRYGGGQTGYPIRRFVDNAVTVLRDYFHHSRIHTNEGRDTYPGSRRAAGSPGLAEPLLADSGEERGVVAAVPIVVAGVPIVPATD